jgi:hypothetical protein
MGPFFLCTTTAVAIVEPPLSNASPYPIAPLPAVTRTNSASTCVHGRPANVGGGGEVSSGMRSAMVTAHISQPQGGQERQGSAKSIVAIDLK